MPNDNNKKHALSCYTGILKDIILHTNNFLSFNIVKS